jgi:hypothetical protein
LPPPLALSCPAFIVHAGPFRKCEQLKSASAFTAAS